MSTTGSGSSSRHSQPLVAGQDSFDPRETADTAHRAQLVSPPSDTQSACAPPPALDLTSKPSAAMVNVDETLRNTRFGQITPPDDDWNPDWGLEEVNLDTTADVPQSEERRISRGSNASAKSATGGRVDKKDKYREKNRVAAAKCRAKKKEHTDGLEETHRTQGMLNALLKQTEQNLRDELSFWRTQALQHGYCECQAIQDYNMRKARALAANTDFGAVDVLGGSSMHDTQPDPGLGSTLHPDPQDFDDLPV